MIWIITSNCKKLSDPTPELVLTYKEIKIPMLDQDQYIFNIFSNVRKSELTDSGNNIFRFQCNNSSDLNTQIKLLSQFLRLKIDGSDIIDDLTILVACDPSINKTITKKINEELAKLQKGKSSIVVNDIFQFLRIVNMDRLKETIKTMLNIPEISTDDPVVLGYLIVECLSHQQPQWVLARSAVILKCFSLRHRKPRPRQELCHLTVVLLFLYDSGGSYYGFIQFY